jgi:hypothetical protein
MKRPAGYSNIDSALLIVATIAWLLAFADHDAGNDLRAWAEIGVAYLLTAAYLVREMRRLSWMVW